MRKCISPVEVKRDARDSMDLEACSVINRSETVGVGVVRCRWSRGGCIRTLRRVDDARRHLTYILVLERADSHSGNHGSTVEFVNLERSVCDHYSRRRRDRSDRCSGRRGAAAARLQARVRQAMASLGWRRILSGLRGRRQGYRRNCVTRERLDSPYCKVDK